MLDFCLLTSILWCFSIGEVSSSSCWLEEEDWFYRFGLLSVFFFSWSNVLYLWLAFFNFMKKVQVNSSVLMMVYNEVPLKCGRCKIKLINKYWFTQAYKEFNYYGTKINLQSFLNISDMNVSIEIAMLIVKLFGINLTWTSQVHLWQEMTSIIPPFHLARRFTLFNPWGLE